MDSMPNINTITMALGDLRVTDPSWGLIIQMQDLRHPRVTENLASVLGVTSHAEGTNPQDRDKVSTRSPNIGDLNQDDFLGLYRRA
jgi:hypothetical protein